MINPMRIRWVGIALVVFSILGTAAVMQFIVRNEERYETQEIISKGNYLASLIALHPLEDFNGKKREIFLRTFSEYLFSERLLYCLIHDKEEQPLMVLAPQGLPAAIPKDVQLRSLHSMGLTTQSYNLNGLKYVVYEFAKPIIDSGGKTGTVRLGFKGPVISIASPDRISLLAMIAFFIFATGTFVYYGMALALKPLKKLYQGLGIQPDSCNAGAEIQKTAGFVSLIKDMEQSFFQIKETLKKTESENAVIAGQLGAATFERNQISKIIDSVDFGIVITDIQDNIRFINAYMANLLKTDKEDLINRALFDVLPDEHLRNFIAHRDSIKTAPAESHIETEFPLYSPGEMFRISLSYLKDNAGSVVSKMISVRDVTQQKVTEKTQHDFIANVAHEFLTPLTTINSYTEMLIDDEVGDRELQKEFYNTISEEVSRLSTFIQNLLNMSKIEMGGLTLDSGLVKSDWLVSDCLMAVEKAALEKKITIHKDLPDNYPTLIGDKELLKTALINLLGNSVKYTPPNGRIQFSLSESDGEVVFNISDTGYGISGEELPHIFEKFFRSKSPQILEQKGSGLGLAMTSEIIQLHNGKIEVQSELNKGTHFTVRLPREEFYLGTQ
ncbi:MAG: PAS domain-containing protein [Desulfobacteraceae bacterium]|nr:MAG: PAS domain-containing protein [Desulfobacteraceae bacterium]